MQILAEPKKRGRRSGPAELATLGDHPDSGEPLRVLRGRFGPYVTDGTVNASLQQGSDPAALTLDEAVGLLAAREQKLRDQGKDPRAPKAKSKARAKPKPRAKAKPRRKRSA